MFHVFVDLFHTDTDIHLRRWPDRNGGRRLHRGHGGAAADAAALGGAARTALGCVVGLEET